MDCGDGRAITYARIEADVVTSCRGIRIGNPRAIWRVKYGNIRGVSQGPSPHGVETLISGLWTREKRALLQMQHLLFHFIWTLPKQRREMRL